MDAGYTNYRSEEDMFVAEGMIAVGQRKKHSKPSDKPHINLPKEHIR
jgi:hypothetical protein